MKITYLINKALSDGSACLCVVPAAEWLAVVNANKGLPPERRRYFIMDYIKDGEELDCMVIEAPFEVYRTWHKEHMASVRNRARGRQFQHLSLDAAVFRERATGQYSEIPAANEQVEGSVCDKAILAELREKLAAWKPWANDLLDLYLLGQKRTCTKVLAKKYGVSPQTIRKYKRQFEERIKKYFSGVSF